MVRALILTLTLTLAAIPVHASEIRVAGITVDVKSFDIESTKSLGGNDRGPALAVLKDGTVLLGGGMRGGSIFSWSEARQELKLLGEMMSKRERIQD
ncbi:MAG: glucose dehydrogenase, partial [Actinobacteria bacterium]|nr:glucose dehydrogenase [Actinomycetota bacterium]